MRAKRGFYLLSTAWLAMIPAVCHAQAAAPASPADAASQQTAPAPATGTAVPGQQTASVASTAASVPTGQASSPDDIVVTANKREESLNRVGLSVTAIGSEALAERRITSVQDIAAAVPGLKYSESGASTPIYTLRGVGFNESSLGVYPSVSVYIDEVPLPFPVLALHSAYDLQRVEALKGPQGTLFGENATGGAINYIAAKPTDTLHYGGDISYGRFNQVDGNAFISGPLGGGFSGRLAVTGMHADGWQQSLTRPGDKNGSTDYVAGRASLAYQGGGLSVLATVNAWKDTSQPQAAQLIALRPQIVGFQTAAEVAAPFADGNARLADWSTTGKFGDVRPRSDREYIQAALRVSLDVGSFATATSLTSYQALKQTQFVDVDGMAPLVSNNGPDIAHIHSFNQELRLANQGSSAFRWVVGANLELSKSDENQSQDFSGSSQDSAPNLFITTTGSDVNQKFRNYAFFGNAQYDLSSAFTLKAGVRYTDSRDAATICGYSNGDGHVAQLFNIIAQAYTAKVPFTPITTGQCYVLNFQGVPGDTYRNTLDQHNVSWLGGVDYHLNQEQLIYANISRGYKAGSYPVLQGSTFAEYIPVNQESVTSYEVGFKGAFADRRVRLNAAAFYYDYANKQVRGKIVDPIFNILDTLLNVPKSRIYGAEGELTVRPVSELTLGGTVTYLNSRILSSNGKDFAGPNSYGLQQDFTGTELTFTPKWSYSVNTEWRHQLGNERSVFAGVDVRGQSSSIAQLGGRTITFAPLALRSITSTNLPFLIPAYATVDARLGYQFGANGPTLMIWGKNIFNKYYVTNANQYLDATVRFAGLPVTFGGTLSFRY